jgi:hypothetical protein
MVELDLIQHQLMDQVEEEVQVKLVQLVLVVVVEKVVTVQLLL